MVDTGLVEVVSKSLGVRGFDLAEFPPLGEGQAGATVAGVMLLIRVVDDSVAKVDGDHERNCDAKVDDNRTNNGDVKVDEGFSCDDDGSMGVDNHVFCMDGQVVSPQKIRAAARGIADLMNKLKEKVKEVKEPKGPKKKNQGNGGQRVKVNKGVNDQGRKLESFEDISGELVQFFSSSSGTVDSNVKPVSDALLRDILGIELSVEMRESLVAPVTLNEIKDVVFAMNALGYPNNNPLLVLQIVDHVVFTSTKGEKQTTVRRPSETCCWVHSIQIPKGCRR
ncbi:hypothetical protein V6N11_050100 [Hibiscus sabdariffa]|uniref:Uncharacterized protein n=1 Tax=Hibiscus sabdariffa TaxID=183260 RepID=A0ABR2T9H2_9ROSI